MTDRPSLRSVAIQCDLLTVPPLEGTRHPSNSKAESITSGPLDDSRMDQKHHQASAPDGDGKQMVVRCMVING